MSAFPSSLGLLLWLARSFHSAHAPGHSSAGKDSRVAWVLTWGYPAWSFLLPRKITQGDMWGFWPHSSGNPVQKGLLVHAQTSAPAHERCTGGRWTWHRCSIKGMCIEPARPDCTAQRCRLLGDPRKKYFTVCSSCWHPMWSGQTRTVWMLGTASFLSPQPCRRQRGRFSCGM